MKKCINCKNNCCSKSFVGLVDAFKHDDTDLFNQILLSQNEVNKIIEKFGADFIEYIDGQAYLALNKDRSCKAFKDGKCLIYDCRPDVCKLYPFYFDPFCGICVDKNCPCYTIDDLDCDKTYQLLRNRIDLFEKIDRDKNYIKRKKNKRC